MTTSSLCRLFLNALLPGLLPLAAGVLASCNESAQAGPLLDAETWLDGR